MDLAQLPGREAAVLAVLREAGGRVLSRHELARAAGLGGLSVRRVDGVLAALRRRLPAGALLTVRGRGWVLADPDPDPSPGAPGAPGAPVKAPGALAGPPAVHRVGTSRKHAGLLPETPAT